jgi:hypothetical protein
MSDDDKPPTPPVTNDELFTLMEAALIDMGRETLARYKRIPGFDHSDDLVLDLVERAVDESDFIALAVVHENRMLIIKHSERCGSAVVIPCADASQVARAALEYGDEKARDTVRRAIRLGVRH